MSISGDTRRGKNRGKYILHKKNPTSFKKGFTPWNKGKGIPHKGNKECSICHKIFYWEIKPLTRKDGYITYAGKPPKTCSKECRYKSASITGTHHIYKICVVCKKEFHFPPSVTKDRATIFCSMECRRKSTINYPEIIKKNAVNEVQKALRNGVLKKQNCEVCKEKHTEAHHFMGYQEKYWLIVKWLCRSHHVKEHNRLRKAGESLML